MGLLGHFWITESSQLPRAKTGQLFKNNLCYLGGQVTWRPSGIFFGQPTRQAAITPKLNTTDGTDAVLQH